VLIRSSHEWEFVGSTIDDAAGESLDKAGKLVGIDYPCGRIIDEIAPWGDPKKYAFPRPMAAKDYGIKMSFSGLKNAFRLKVEELNLQGDSLPKMWWQSKNPLPEFQKLYDLLASYQSAVMQSLFTKMQLAHKQVGNIPIVFGGGVACNSHLRTLVADWSAKQNAKSYFVSPIYCTDNGAMIANFAYRNQMMATPFPACLSLDAKSSTLLAKKDGLS
jgi:N6-L-threonylcarbamoyladenine synthase